MSTLPTEIRSALAHHLSKATADAREGDAEAAADHVESVESVTREGVPSGQLRDRLLHGCAEVDDLVETDPETATEYLRSMERLLEKSESP
ncbi:hypothetical protein SAMN04487948_104392 [Halogranum amylolyticum]|uniref:DUF8101 domain-containing protein n=1 Tax=Halogranum amylolyticum TaxID=660520 RepID=A0A1H8S1Y8_9EURY|nr:hypothetical protein [Halogranum amylolyticum]SEO72701.1 hypothetical protein SAMN04487948_104392 [Halogranum amylolyticum]